MGRARNNCTIWAEHCHIEKARSRLHCAGRSTHAGFLWIGGVEQYFPFWITVSGTDAVLSPPSLTSH